MEMKYQTIYKLMHWQKHSHVVQVFFNQLIIIYTYLDWKKWRHDRQTHLWRKINNGNRQHDQFFPPSQRAKKKRRDCFAQPWLLFAGLTFVVLAQSCATSHADFRVGRQQARCCVGVAWKRVIRRPTVCGIRRTGCGITWERRAADGIFASEAIRVVDGSRSFLRRFKSFQWVGDQQLMMTQDRGVWRITNLFSQPFWLGATWLSGHIARQSTDGAADRCK